MRKRRVSTLIGALFLLLLVQNAIATSIGVWSPLIYCEDVGLKPEIQETLYNVNNGLNESKYEELSLLGEDCCNLTIDEAKCRNTFEISKKNGIQDKSNVVIYYLIIILSILYLIFGKRIIKNKAIYVGLLIISILVLLSLIYQIYILFL